MPPTAQDATIPRPATQDIDWNDFLKVELRVGRVLSARAFPEARKPAYVLEVDFGPDIGVRKSSAQITGLYSPEQLVGKLVVAVVNFPKKQIGPLMSECLVTGFHNEHGDVALCVPDRPVPLGTRMRYAWPGGVAQRFRCGLSATKLSRLVPARFATRLRSVASSTCTTS